MFTDDWVISQLFVQMVMGILMAYTLLKTTKIIRYWQPQYNTTLQIRLEQESYLVNNVLWVVLCGQFLLFVYFLQTVNYHIPPLLRGAMCATGALGANEYGFLVLYTKILVILFAIIFLSVDYWDNKTPYFVLTPSKYYWVFPVVLLFFYDLYLSYLYFSKLNPDIITTCCSVNFLTKQPDNYLPNFLSNPNAEIINISFWLFYILGFLLFLFPLLGLGGLVLLFFGLNIWILNAIFLLKNFFVKYIYGVPSHNCLFDIFFGEYYFVGYVIFGGYFLMWALAMWKLVFYVFEKRILNQKNTIIDKNVHKNLFSKIYKIEIIVNIVNIIIPTIYFLMWKGEL